MVITSPLTPILIRVILYFLLSAFLSCSTKPASEPEAQADTRLQSDQIRLSPEQVRTVGIQLEPPQFRSLASEIRVSGFLDVPPQNLISVSVRMGGFVKSTSILQGIHVHQGEVLCTLENPEYLILQQEYNANRSRLRFLEKESGRQSELAFGNAASEKESERSLSEFQSLKAIQEGLRNRLILLGFSIPNIEKGQLSSVVEVRSPANGYVTEVGIHLGKFVESKDLVCEIVNLDHLHAELMAYEKDLPNLKEGQDIRFVRVAGPEKSYSGNIYLINRKVNADHTVKVHAHIKGRHPELIPNMTISAVIRSGVRKVWTVPSKAVVNSGGKSILYSAGQQPGVFFPVEVEIGQQEGDRVEVKFPKPWVPSSLQIVTTGSYDLKSFSENTTGEE